ncbi:MAG: hypothetical protein JXQ77_04825 [Campylobacterales bacterium]|nr:hypothetical protein [Campylobacterales bacterium]
MNEKEALLKEIETLISYGKEESTINPELLQYLEIKDLNSIKESLLRKVGTLSDEDKVWLEQFKKYE